MNAGRSRLAAVYALAHGVGEFCTALMLYSMLTGGAVAGWQIVAYSTLAFGCPLLFAALATRRRFAAAAEGQVALAGLVVMATALLLGRLGPAAIVLLGLGSALFHIAAGTATLKIGRPGTGVGVFESTGAIGLAAGALLGGSLGAGAWQGFADSMWVFLAVAIMLVGGLAALAWGTPSHPGLGAKLTPSGDTSQTVVASMTSPWSKLAGWLTGRRLPTSQSWTLRAGTGMAPVMALLALAAISITRSVTGFSAPQPWKNTAAMVVTASVLVALGRAFGGLMADQAGFAATGAVAFLGAAACLGLSQAWVGLAGVFFLAATMAPMILGLMASTSSPSLAFGFAQLFQVPAAFTAGLVFAPGLTQVLLVVCAVLVVAIRPLDYRRSHDSA